MIWYRKNVAVHGKVYQILHIMPEAKYRETIGGVDVGAAMVFPCGANQLA
jgi:hypothetical protein